MTSIALNKKYKVYENIKKKVHIDNRILKYFLQKLNI